MFKFIKNLFSKPKTTNLPSVSYTAIPYNAEVNKILTTIQKQPNGLRALSREVNIPKDTLNRRLTLLKELKVVDSVPSKNMTIYSLLSNPNQLVINAKTHLDNKYSVLFS